MCTPRKKKNSPASLIFSPDLPFPASRTTSLTRRWEQLIRVPPAPSPEKGSTTRLSICPQVLPANAPLPPFPTTCSQPISVCATSGGRSGAGADASEARAHLLPFSAETQQQPGFHATIKDLARLEPRLWQCKKTQQVGPQPELPEVGAPPARPPWGRHPPSWKPSQKPLLYPSNILLYSLMLKFKVAEAEQCMQPW